MSKAKVRTSVQVDVEDFDAVNPAIEVAAIEKPIQNLPVYKSELGFWWDCLSGLVLLQALLNIFRSLSAFSSRSDVAVALVISLTSVALAVAMGRYAGKESSGRKFFGFVFIALGLGCGILSFALGSLPATNFWTYAAIALTVTGWSLRRLLGESVIRCLSLGLIAAFPILFLGGDLLGAVMSSVQQFFDATTLGMIGVFADVYAIPFATIDGGVKFATGELRSIATVGNIAGILVALAASIGIAVLAKQSLISAAFSLIAAGLWWTAFRAAYGVNMATSKTLDGPLAELAMPILSLLALLILIVATNYCIHFIFAVIPMDPGQFEVSPLTLLYNACVSFPQLGPVPPGLLIEKAKEAPMSKEDLILDEYQRAKEASQSAMGAQPSTHYRELQEDE